MSRQQHGPLADLRVIDMTTTLMGPYCGLLLAQMGADVVKVERPQGDVARYISDRSGQGLGPIYMNLNRGKRSVVLNVKEDQGDLAALQALIAEADVFSHNLRPSSAARLGLSYDDVSGLNPRLIYCSMHGFDARGPWRDKPAYDDTVQAASGMAAMQGGQGGGAPSYVKSPIADKTVGVFAVAGILAALHERSLSGMGQQVSVPMYETMVAFTAMDHQGDAVYDPPMGPHGYARMESPDRRPYETADGFIAVLVYTDNHWLKFFQLIGRPDLVADQRFNNIGGRTEHIDELYKVVADVLPEKTTEEWLRILDTADIPAAPVMNVLEVMAAAQSVASGVFEPVEHPILGPLRQPGMPITFDRTPTASVAPAVLLGANTTDVLAERAARSAASPPVREPGNAFDRAGSHCDTDGAEDND